MEALDQTDVAEIPGQGRGGIILGLGIVALLLLGPILGIPAWVMGRSDLRRIRNGEITHNDKSMTQIGMVLGIVGTFFSPLFLIGSSIIIAVTFSLLNARDINERKTAMISDATNIAYAAHQYRKRPTGASGGGGSYEGFALSNQMKRTNYGAYQIRIFSSDRIQIIGASLYDSDDGLIAYVNENGFIDQWEYSGAFQPRFYFRSPSPLRKYDSVPREGGHI